MKIVVLVVTNFIYTTMLVSFFTDDEPVSIIVHVSSPRQKQVPSQQSACIKLPIIFRVKKYRNLVSAKAADTLVRRNASYLMIFLSF
jgi:hypothetical protein